MVLEVFRSVVLAAEMWLALSDVRPPPRMDEVVSSIGATPVLVVYYANKHEVPVSEAFALASHESNFRDWRVSSAGCIGTLQIQPRYYCQDADCSTPAARIERGLEVWKRRRAQESTHFDAARAYARGRRGARSNPEAGAGYASAYLRIERHLRPLGVRDASPVAPPCPPYLCRPYTLPALLARSLRSLAHTPTRVSSLPDVRFLP